jgi:hypothetical protein
MRRRLEKVQIAIVNCLLRGDVVSDANCGGVDGTVYCR